jgi:hypothetical protein
MPRWATRRNYDRETLGGDLAAISAELGNPFMDWQSLVADVAMELDPDGSLHYRKIIITIHRQAGKTTLILPAEIHRCVAWKKRQRVIYAAQNRNMSRDKLLEDQIPLIQESALGEFGKAERRNGSESWKWDNGSRIGLMSNTKRSGHGSTNNMVVLDEAFAQVDWRVEQSLSPTMSRVPETQWWTISTAGDETSVYLLEQVRRGRHLVESGIDQRVAYFEWSIPLDADMDDHEVWFDNMPGLGHGISLEYLISERASMPDMEFRRAYGNQWVEGMLTNDSVIKPVHWNACMDRESTIAKKSVRRLSIDVAPDQSSASIGVAGFRKDGLEHLEAIETREGTDWIVDRVASILAKRDTFSNLVAIDISTPAAALIPALEAQGIEVLPISGRDWNAACASFFDASVQHEYRHIDDRDLNLALSSAGRAESGEGWHWKRRGSAPITPLCAVTLAHWALMTSEDGYDVLSSFF